MKRREKLMDAHEWRDCPLIEIDAERVSGAPVLRGTRLPAETLLDNVDGYMDEGQSLEQAIFSTLESFPSTPGGAETIRTLLAYRETHEHQPAL
jgi:uncharacterized protein (DUF433 family)